MRADLRGFAAFAATVLLAALLAGCSNAASVQTSAGGAAGRGESSGGQSISTGLTRWAPPDRARLARVAGRALGGGRVDVSRWRGHVVVINTWGSWCGPCRKEAPDLRRVSDDTSSLGVRFVGIDTRDNDAAAKAFVREFAIRYPSIVDDDGRVMLALADTVPVSAVPTTLVVDRRGRVAARVIGAVTASTLRGLIDDVRAEHGSGSAAPPSSDAGAGR